MPFLLNKTGMVFHTRFFMNTFSRYAQAETNFMPATIAPVKTTGTAYPAATRQKRLRHVTSSPFS